MREFCFSKKFNFTNDFYKLEAWVSLESPNVTEAFDYRFRCTTTYFAVLAKRYSLSISFHIFVFKS